MTPHPSLFDPPRARSLDHAARDRASHLFGAESPPPLSGNEAAVYDALCERVGRARATKADDLGAMLGLGVRDVQRAVHALIHVHGVPVGSAMSPPHGYYVARTQEEREEVAALFHRRALAMLRTEMMLLRAGRDEVVRRVQTDLGDEAA